MRMPDPFLPASVAVLILGLLATAGWGVGDFGGGLASRFAPVLGVLLWSQVASLTVGVPILLASHEPAMRLQDLAIGVAGGAFGGIGLSFLYRGLSVGRMGVVAPVAAVITSGLPVIFGFVIEGIPSELAIVGIAFAFVSVILVSRTPPEADGRPSGLRYAVTAGSLFGAFTILVSQLGDGLLATPVVLIRVASIVTIAGWIVLGRREWRVPRRLVPGLFAVGVMDMLATAAYLSAISIGPLAIAAAVASLYPVVTTLLASVVLRERMTPIHATGILAAGAAVALIAGAGAG
jgi:drug/metabolite transporter (DMT)-like permease